MAQSSKRNETLKAIYALHLGGCNEFVIALDQNSSSQFASYLRVIEKLPTKALLKEQLRLLVLEKAVAHGSSTTAKGPMEITERMQKAWKLSDHDLKDPVKVVNAIMAFALQSVFAGRYGWLLDYRFGGPAVTRYRDRLDAAQLTGDPSLLDNLHIRMLDYMVKLQVIDELMQAYQVGGLGAYLAKVEGFCPVVAGVRKSYVFAGDLWLLPEAGKSTKHPVDAVREFRLGLFNRLEFPVSLDPRFDQLGKLIQKRIKLELGRQVPVVLVNAKRDKTWFAKLFRFVDLKERFIAETVLMGYRLRGSFDYYFEGEDAYLAFKPQY